MSAEPVERFKPTSGYLVGYAGLASVAVTVGYAALRVHTVTGLQVALGAVLSGLVVWVTQLRSRAAAYPDRLLLKNALRDVEIPLVLVDEVAVRQTLNVWVGDRRYTCLGIGRSMRDLVQRRPGDDTPGPLGTSRLREFSLMAQKAGPEQTAMSYPTFVEVRVEELVEQARKQAAGRVCGARPRRSYAWPEIAGLVVAGLAFLASLYLL
jgi:hypothetical protein